MTQLQANNKTQRLTLTAMLTVIALMFSYVEAMIPVTFGIPGFKLGFANIMIIIAIYVLDASFAFGINIFRIHSDNPAANLQVGGFRDNLHHFRNGFS